MPSFTVCKETGLVDLIIDDVRPEDETAVAGRVGVVEVVVERDDVGAARHQPRLTRAEQVDLVDVVARGEEDGR